MGHVLFRYEGSNVQGNERLGPYLRGLLCDYMAMEARADSTTRWDNQANNTLGKPGQATDKEAAPTLYYALGTIL